MNPVLIVSEEASAAMYARELAAAFAARGVPVASTADLGDPAVPCVAGDPAPLSAFGLFELPAALPAHLRKFRAVAAFIARQRPAAVVTVDYGGFAMLLARAFGRRAPFHFFIPPKIWAWGAFRARVAARDFAGVLTILPFEADLWRRAGARASFVGHPLVELVAPYAAEEKEKGSVALLPGSRPGEVRSTLPALVAAVDLMREASPDLRFSLLLAGRADRAEVEAALAGRPVEILADEPSRRRALARAELALSKSGTAVLEAALLGTPTVAFYRVNAATAWVARRILRVRRVTLPNIVLGEDVVPELLQGEMNGPAIARAGLALLRNGSLRRHTLDRFARLRALLAPPGGGSVFAAAADRILGAEVVAA